MREGKRETDRGPEREVETERESQRSERQNMTDLVGERECQGEIYTVCIQGFLGIRYHNNPASCTLSALLGLFPVCFLNNPAQVSLVQSHLSHLSPSNRSRPYCLPLQLKSAFIARNMSPLGLQDCHLFIPHMSNLKGFWVILLCQFLSAPLHRICPLGLRPTCVCQTSFNSPLSLRLGLTKFRAKHIELI